MTICAAFTDADIPTIDLQLLEVSLDQRIRKDQRLLTQVRRELYRRQRQERRAAKAAASSVVKSDDISSPLP